MYLYDYSCSVPVASCAHTPEQLALLSSHAAAAPCASRWRAMRALPWDRAMLETWHKLLAVLAVATGRTAVVPLFECVGILDPRGRVG